MNQDLINFFSQIETNSFWLCYYYKIVVLNMHSYYYANTKDTLFVGFRFLVLLNYLQLLIVQIILEVWLADCLGLRSLIIFLLFYYLLIMVLMVHYNAFLNHHLVVVNFIFLFQHLIFLYSL